MGVPDFETLNLALSLKDFFNLGLIYIFGVLIFLDILTGICKAWVTRQVNSTISREGFVRHGAIFLTIIISFPILTLFGLKDMATGFVLYLIYVYLVSIIENLNILGVPFPKFMLKRFSKLKKEMEDKEE